MLWAFAIMTLKAQSSISERKLLQEDLVPVREGQSIKPNEINDFLRQLENLPDSFDLIIIRDLFIHLKNDEILKIINKINNSNIKFLAVTSYHNSKINIDL